MLILHCLVKAVAVLTMASLTLMVPWLDVNRHILVILYNLLISLEDRYDEILDDLWLRFPVFHFECRLLWVLLLEVVVFMEPGVLPSRLNEVVLRPRVVVLLIQMEGFNELSIFWVEVRNEVLISLHVRNEKSVILRIQTH